MQNNVKRTYCIGDFRIGYHGPAFPEKEILSKFRIKSDEVDCIYEVKLVKHITEPTFVKVHIGEYIDVYQNEDETVRLIYGENRSEIVIKDICKDGKQHLVELHEKWLDRCGTNLILKLFDLPYQIISHDGVFLHASYVVWKEKAILFTAPKQTGKSTQAKLWQDFRGAQIVNGDRALLRRTKEGWRVFGSPYCGTSKICENISCPLGAIVTLSQAKKNVVRMEKTLDAYKALLDGMSFQTWNKNEVSKVTDLVSDLILNVPMMKLECLPNEEAVEVLEEMLW